MWCTDTFITIFELDSKSNRVSDAKSTPTGTYTTFDCSQRLSVGMATLKARSAKFFPDIGKVLFVGAEEVNSLPEGFVRPRNK